MNLRREQLLGYLLGALDPAEQEQVVQALAVNPRLRQELAEIKQTLDQVGLSGPPEPIEPPAGLAERTCDYVAANADSPLVALPAERHAGGGNRSYTLSDLLVAASVLIVLGALVFPSLVQSRFLAQMVACQNNVRQIGLAMWLDSESRPDRSYWRVPYEHPHAVVGMTASSLVSNHFIPSPDTAVCPTSEEGLLTPGFPMPTPEQLQQSEGNELRRLQRLVGGSYAYPFGYVVDGRIVPTRNMYRENYCLIAEGPRWGRTKSNHSGRGGNIFFEDGHFRWVDTESLPALPDDPYRNRIGQSRAAGLDIHDAVLGGSEMRPVVPVLPIVNR